MTLYVGLNKWIYGAVLFFFFSDFKGICHGMKNGFHGAFVVS